jgi:transposase
VDLPVREDWLVAKGYRPVVRDQEFLLPPNMTEWLPDGHLAWFVIDTVAELDISAFHQRAARRRDGRERASTAGRAAYDPDMLLTLLIYAYACGQRSSRQIERLCETDVGFRVICAQDAPDHTVISRFRQIHQEAFVGLFAQVLRLCRAAGLARLGTVAIDGFKLAANASTHANRGAEWLAEQAAKMDAADAAGSERAEQAAAEVAAEVAAEAVQRADRETVQAILAEAEQLDAAEDAEFGPDSRGDERPPGWHGRAGRRARIRAAHAKIEALEAARRAEADRARAERAEHDAAALAEAEQALDRELATREAARDAWERQWERAAADPSLPLPRGRAPVPAEQSVQVRRARQRVERAHHRVEHPDSAPRPGGRRVHSQPAPTGPETARRGRRGRRDPDKPQANITDPDSTVMPVKNGGWDQAYNAQVGVSADHIIVTLDVTTNPADIASYHTMIAKTEQVAAELDATAELGTLLFDTGYCSDETCSRDPDNPGPDRLIATGKSRSIRQAARDNPADGPPPANANPRDAMDHRLRTPEGATLYTRRGATVEPTIGNLQKILDTLSSRGLATARHETHFAAAVHNLLRIHRTATT